MKRSTAQRTTNADTNVGIACLAAKNNKYSTHTHDYPVQNKHSLGLCYGF
jgi:hypothetical protein